MRNWKGEMTENLTPDQFCARAEAVEAQVGQFIVGQKDVVRYVLVCILAGGRVLRRYSRQSP